jgi:hypothetical protein
MAPRLRAIVSIGCWLALAAGCGGGGGAKPSGGAAGGGRAGAGGVAGLAGAAGGVPALVAPAGWTCGGSAYGDGRCDCGCGVADPDCAQHDLAHCEVCDRGGSCNLAACPGRVDPGNVTACLPPPAGWTCTPATYADGHQCECGCGIPDPDCADGTLASCDDCLAQGSCASGLCPSSILADDNAHCGIPARWICPASSWGDGVCDCGCGVLDPDCPDASAASCQNCDQSSCSPFACTTIQPADNAHCTVPPFTWQCSPRLYGDGARCDCGCGAVDPDCASQGLEACDRCDDPGACSVKACPGIVDPASNAHCQVPPTPPGWTCGPGTYGDGNACDCGCGIPDVDCRTSDPSICVRCLECGGDGKCAGTIEPADTTQCAPPPAGWTCSAAAYRNISCDCGCGIPDPMCQGIHVLYVCENFPVEGCSGGKKAHVDPSDNSRCIVTIPAGWTCDRSFYDDGLCDCGCGALDLDCAANDVSACDSCNGAGSCSAGACPGSIAPADIAHCTP